MEPTALQHIAFRWIEAFNARELERLLDLYADDAQHYSPKLKIHQPETNGLVKGRDALRNWWRGAYERLPSLYYKPGTFTASADRVFIEYTRQVDGEPDMLVAEVFDVKEGKIVFSRVYHG
jgi:limonene-1,2-epoxide hydrolase